MKDSIYANFFFPPRRLRPFNRYLLSTYICCSVFSSEGWEAFLDGRMTFGSLWTGPGVGESPGGEVYWSLLWVKSNLAALASVVLCIYWCLCLLIPGWRLNFMKHKMCTWQQPHLGQKVREWPKGRWGTRAYERLWQEMDVLGLSPFWYSGCSILKGGGSFFISQVITWGVSYLGFHLDLVHSLEERLSRAVWGWRRLPLETPS